MGSQIGLPDDKLEELDAWESSDRFSARERVALEYADAMTFTDRDVDDALFERVREEFDQEAIVELTATIAWENASSKFNRALRVPAQGLWDQVRQK
ncbi:MAG: carboxymuconolactone decarboxylase family protein [Sphaerobacteraceae bacterium]|nr:MAG: carboxymuconolactone decarboxylase family protein [Sphaerobacteraceae bacterium]